MPKSEEHTTLFKATIGRFGFTAAAIQKSAESCTTRIGTIAVLRCGRWAGPSQRRILSQAL
jgi:hypothetical protein